MLKKDFKKVRVYLEAGYGGHGVNASVLDEAGKTIARIDVDELEKKLGQDIRGGHFKFSNKGRKYQYITMK